MNNSSAVSQSDGHVQHASVVDDRLTLIAFAVISGFFAAILHEALGHGVVAYLQGSRALTLTNCYLSSDISTRSIDAGGTLVNLFIGAAAWTFLKMTTKASFNLRYFLWLTMTLNLFDGTGYIFYSGVAGIGDWQQFSTGLHPYWVWRAGLALLGGLLYYGMTLPLSVRWLTRLVADAGEGNTPQRLGRLTVLPYLAIGVAGTVAAIPNLLGWKLIVISAAAATFGGLFGFLFIRPGVLRNFPKQEHLSSQNPGYLQRNTLLIVLAVIIFVLNVAVFGRGLTLQGNRISIASQRSTP